MLVGITEKPSKPSIPDDLYDHSVDSTPASMCSRQYFNIFCIVTSFFAFCWI